MDINSVNNTITISLDEAKELFELMLSIDLSKIYENPILDKLAASMDSLIGYPITPDVVTVFSDNKNAVEINTNVQLNDNMQNASIRFNYDAAKDSGIFTISGNTLKYITNLTDTILFNITITSDNVGDIKVTNIDNSYYDFQYIINSGDKDKSLAIVVQKKVYYIMNDLLSKDIISNWKVGDYI